MTLYRQLLVFTLLLFALLFAGVWVEKLQSTRSFLITQLQSHAQDTATSLGLSLSPGMAENDMPTVEAMMNAVFDRGYYRIISLKDMQGKNISERTLVVESEGVPEWFVSLIPIKSPGGEALVMAGWNQAGKLYVESHPGYAYQTLWETMIRINVYFLVAGTIVLLLGGFGLRLLLKPLKRVELQAKAICRKEYQIQETLPKTRELRQAVEAMNRMTTQVREMFAAQAKVAQRLRRKAYSDQLTGLGNRRYLTAQVDSCLEAAPGTVRGILLLLHLDHLQKLNECEGFAAGDALLKKVAEILRQETRLFNDVTLARITGGDFAIFVSQISATDAVDLAEQLNNKVARVAGKNIENSDSVAHIGGIVFAQTSTLAHLLSEADNALQTAHRQGPNKCFVASLSAGKDAVAKGKSWWKETLEKVLEKEEIILFGQPVMSSADQGLVLHQELLSRIVLDSGEIISAGNFVPLAERLQLGSRLDKVVFTKVFQQRQLIAEFGTIAVNVSPASIQDPVFVDWILAELSHLPRHSPHIIFEFPEYGAVQYLDVVKEFSRKVRLAGHATGLDHFGRSFSNFGYLKSLRPEYVKIDRAFIKELEHQHGDSEFFIGALCGVAHSLGIRVIAEGVEREDQVGRLLELNIDALQGYLFGEPRMIFNRR
jgi:diguanylate cyclase (GGDEF)-like protein